MVAVFKELRQSGDHQLSFWCDKKFGPQAKGIFQKFDSTIPIDLIIAGKLRRYHGMTIWQQLHPSIVLPNLRDFFKVVAGFFQSLYKLVRLRL